MLRFVPTKDPDTTVGEKPRRPYVIPLDLVEKSLVRDMNALFKTINQKLHRQEKCHFGNYQNAND
jgi:ribosomal protein L14E/L6E/L27E